MSGLGGRSAGTLRRLLDVADAGEIERHLVRRQVLKVEYDPAAPASAACSSALPASTTRSILHRQHPHPRSDGQLGEHGDLPDRSSGARCCAAARSHRHRRRRDRHQRRRRPVDDAAARAGAGDDAGPAGARHAPVLEQWRARRSTSPSSTIRPPAWSVTPGSSSSAASQRHLPDPPFHSRGGRSRRAAPRPAVHDRRRVLPARHRATGGDHRRGARSATSSCGRERPARASLRLRSWPRSWPAPAPPRWRPSAEAARAAHGDGVVAVLFYGSCRRDGYREGLLVDLYLMVDGLRRRPPLAADALAEPPGPAQRVLSRDRHGGARGPGQVRAGQPAAARTAGPAPTTLNPYFWARFAQPTGLAVGARPRRRRAGRRRAGRRRS